MKNTKIIKIGDLIIDLCQLLSKNSLHINYPWQNNSKYEAYFKLAGAEKRLTDEIIAEKLGYKGPKDKAFVRLQNRFEQKLSYLIFTLDQSKEERTEYAIKSHEVVLNYSQGKLLLDRNMRPAAMYYLNKAMNIATNTSIPKFEYLLAVEFYRYYSTMVFNKKLKEYYFDLLNEKSEEIKYELVVKSYESELVEMVTHKVNMDKLKVSSRKFANECLEILKTRFSYQLFFTAYSIIVFDFNLHREYDKIFDYSDKALAILKRRGLLTPGILYMIEETYINALVAKGEFSEAIKYIDTHHTGVKEGSHRYFGRMRIYFVALMRLKRYAEMVELTEAILNSKSISIYARFNELWLIKKGYLHLLFELGVMDDQEMDIEVMSQYKLNKLLNEINIYHKDKSGQNASLRILEMAFFIVRKSEDKLIDKIEGIKQYAYKYLRNDENMRFRIFFRFLITCYEKNFNVKAIERHTQDIKAKLFAHPQILADSIADPEVVPLEDLWDYILNYIEREYPQKA